MKKGLFIVLTLSLFSNIDILNGQPQLPPDHYSTPVLFRAGTRYGSGFRIFIDSNCYFVTARHVLFDSSGKLKDSLGEISFRSWILTDTSINLFRLDLKLLWSLGLLRHHETHDVAVALIGRLRGHYLDRIITTYLPGIDRITSSSSPAAVFGFTSSFDSVRLSDQVFVIGYPLALAIRNQPQLDYTRPLLRNGTVAGKNLLKKTIVLDCMTHWGYSGCPIIEVLKNGDTISFPVIGLISESVPIKERWTEQDVSESRYSNSGYSIAEPIDFVIELANEISKDIEGK